MKIQWNSYRNPWGNRWLFSWYFHRIPMGILLDFHGVLWNPYSHSYGSSVWFLWLLGFLWGLFAIAIGFLLDSCGMSRICLWLVLRDFFAIAIGFLLDSCKISMICLWCFYWNSMGFPWVLWYFDAIAMASLCGFHCVFSDISLGFFWEFHRFPQGFL